MHKSVLLDEAIDSLCIKDGGIYVDGTCGFGGHSFEIAKRNEKGIVVVLDKDTFALGETVKKLSSLKTKTFSYNGGFEDMQKILESFSIKKVDGILLDLGISSYQLDSSKRGFTFRYDEDLLMTMKQDPTKEDLTAYDVVNTWSKDSLEAIISGFGEEKFYKRIVAGIVSARDISPIKTTSQLVEIIQNSVPGFYRKGKIHPATKTFQAIRMAVNGELSSLENFLSKVTDLLNTNGVVSIISFHSLEDRMVKRAFIDLEKRGLGTRITKKPIVPSSSEIKENPRSRSAKLRVFKKVQ